jgi:hypothetical protein
MTTLPQAELAFGRLSDLHRRNILRLGRDDIVVASNGGSGQSLIGNILFELGLNYVDTYTEVLLDDGRGVGVEAHAGYRRHLASLHDKDAGDGGRPDTAVWPRFTKTHHPPVVFEHAPIGGVWILVRDPRDALYAAYQWRVSFAEEPWDLVPDTLAEWLRGPGDYTRTPVDDWPAFYRSWSERARQCEHSHVLRFEDLKTRPVEVVSDALRALGLTVPDAEIQRAVDASSFSRMREHEDRVATMQPQGKGQGRIVRAGKTDGWKDWMTPELADCFSGAELHEVARRYGYDLSEVS